jgi:alginate O-acetyltransferase complex protein AlgI
MVFSSNEFLFVYLLPTLILYFLAPPRFKNLVLLALSLVFYGWEKPSYLFLMVLVIIESYSFGLLIERAKGEKVRHAIMIVQSYSFL